MVEPAGTTSASWRYKKSNSTAKDKVEWSVSSDVTSMVATWAGDRDHDDYGFMLRAAESDVPQPLGPGACMTHYEHPRLTVVSF